jgi:hypothetical protein
MDVQATFIKSHCACHFQHCPKTAPHLTIPSRTPSTADPSLPKPAADPSPPPSPTATRGVHASGKITGGGVGNEPPSPKMRTGQWCTAGRPLFYEKIPAVRGFFPSHSKTGSGRPGPCVKGGVRRLPPPGEGGGFGPAGRKAVGGLAGNPLRIGTVQLGPELLTVVNRYASSGTRISNRAPFPYVPVSRIVIPVISRTLRHMNR